MVIFHGYVTVNNQMVYDSTLYPHDAFGCMNPILVSSFSLQEHVLCINSTAGSIWSNTEKDGFRLGKSELLSY